MGKKDDKLKMEMDDLQLIPKRETANYELGEKLLGIAFMDASQRDFGGIMTPKYEETSRMLSVPASTLHNWWKNRDEIRKLGDTALEEIPKQAALKLAIGTMKIVNALEKKGYSNMSTRDLTNLLNTYITKMRLLSGRSTQNIDGHMTFSPVAPAK